MAEFEHDMAAELKRDHLRQDRDDLNNDMAGRDTGRIKRFVTAGESGHETEDDKNEDADLRAYADFFLEQQRQERIAALYSRYDDIDQKFDKAIAKSKEELEEAHRHRDEIYENGTDISGDRKAFLNKDTGYFQYENGERVNKADELEARNNYRVGDTVSNDMDAANVSYIGKKQQLRELENKQREFQDKYGDLEDSDIPLDDIEDEFDDIEADLDWMAETDETDLAVTTSNERSTSFAKTTSPENNSENSLTAAFAKAGREQLPVEPVHENESDKPSYQSSGMAFG